MKEEDRVAEFASNHQNINSIKTILQNSSDMIALFMLTEALSKNFFGKKQIGIVQKCKLILTKIAMITIHPIRRQNTPFKRK